MNKNSKWDASQDFLNTWSALHPKPNMTFEEGKKAYQDLKDADSVNRSAQQNKGVFDPRNVVPKMKK